MLSQDRLKELFHYDKETGIFTRLTSRGGCKVGSRAGNADRFGYRRIMVDKVHYLAHRLVFLYVDGYFPEYEVDHKNGITTDNRWVNLRHVTKLCNSQNLGIRKNNSSGFPGVTWRSSRSQWYAQVAIATKVIYLGASRCVLDAALARFDMGNTV